MSPRQPAVDADGRPIVAELGRAETPQEAAERKAENSRKRRSNQTTLNLVVALLASLGVVLLVVLVVVRPGQSMRAPVDYHAAAADAQRSVTTTLADPDLPSGWSANRAELDTAETDGVTAWRIGFLTPTTQYIALDQGIDANPTWVSTLLDGAHATGTTTLAAAEWQVYDRRDKTDTGNLAYALVTTVPAASADGSASTIVLSGTASDAEFATLASAVLEKVAQ